MAPPVPLQCVYNVPLALDAEPSNIEDLDLSEGRANCHFNDLVGHVIGPMPPGQFIKLFLPRTPGEVDKVAKNLFQSVPTQAEERSGIYDPLAEVLNRLKCSDFVFDVTAKRIANLDKPDFMKPSIVCYTPENLAIVRETELSSRADLGYAEFFIEVAPSPAYDVFRDPPEDADRAARASHDFMPSASKEEGNFWVGEEGKKIKNAFGRHVMYAAEVLTRQPRISLFTVAMFGAHVRLILWDRSGCVVTQAFDVRTKPVLLNEFLVRLCDREQGPVRRGHDTSFQCALPAEEELFRDAIAAYIRTQLAEGEDVEAALATHYAPGRVYAAHVLHNRAVSVAKNTTRLVFSRPVANATALNGRGTRGYWAVDPAKGKVVFLKDTWSRSDFDDVEGDTLEFLEARGVRNIPSLVCHGYVPHVFREFAAPLCDEEVQGSLLYSLVPGEHAESPPWACLSGVKDPDAFAKSRHYRLVMGTVGYPLSTVRDTKELLHATYDVFTAMRGAFDNARFLHRDISVPNIVLVQEPGSDIRRGYLIDWDVASIADKTGVSLNPGRTGAWRFLSRRLVESDAPDELRHTFVDDQESLLYAVLFCAYMWQKHDQTPRGLAWIIWDLFDCGARGPDVDPKTGRDSQGRPRWGKAHLVEWGRHLNATEWGDRALTRWLKCMFDLMGWEYNEEGTWSWERWHDTEAIAEWWRKSLDDPDWPLDRANRVVNVPRYGEQGEDEKDNDEKDEDEEDEEEKEEEEEKGGSKNEDKNSEDEGKNAKKVEKAPEVQAGQKRKRDPPATSPEEGDVELEVEKAPEESPSDLHESKRIKIVHDAADADATKD